MIEIIYKITQYKTFKAIVSAIVGFGIYFIGVEHYDAVIAMTLLCFIDFLFAMYVLHKKKGQLTSEKFPNKMITWIVYLILIGTMNILGKTSQLFGSYMVDVLIVWFSLGQVISIAEHAGELGYNLPFSILKDLKKTRDEQNIKLDTLEIKTEK